MRDGGRCGWWWLSSRVEIGPSVRLGWLPRARRALVGSVGAGGRNGSYARAKTAGGDRASMPDERFRARGETKGGSAPLAEGRGFGKARQPHHPRTPGGAVVSWPV
jgi:hypothetical protein